MIGKVELDLGILIPRAFDRSAAASFLHVLTNEAPALAPLKYGFFEPVTTPYSRDEVINGWNDPFLWRASGVEGNCWTGNAKRHTSVYMTVKHTAVREAQTRRFLDAIIKSFDVDFAYVSAYFFDGSETSSEFGHEVYRAGVTTHQLTRCIPGSPPWLLYLGGPYGELVGSQCLTEAGMQPLAKSDGSFGYWFEAAASINLAAADRQAYMDARRRLRERLSHLFCGNDATSPPRFVLT